MYDKTTLLLVLGVSLLLGFVIGWTISDWGNTHATTASVPARNSPDTDALIREVTGLKQRVGDLQRQLEEAKAAKPGRYQISNSGLWTMLWILPLVNRAGYWLPRVLHTEAAATKMQKQNHLTLTHSRNLAVRGVLTLRNSFQ